MIDSFVFYKSFFDAIELIPNENEQLQIYKALCNLAYNGIEADTTEFSDIQKAIYLVTEKQIKASVQHRIDGSKGGRPSKKPTEETLEKRGVFNGVSEKTESHFESNGNVNVNDNDNVNENVNANGEKAPTHLTSSQTKLSKTIFNIFKDAGLPCQKQNEISFLQTDFANAMSYLHKTPEYKHLHSDDLIEAIKNYITVLEDTDSYITCRMDFFTLVKSKTFYSFLPANFDKMNFKKFDNGKDEPQKKPKREFYFSQPCPKCHALKLVWSNDRQLYECRSCHKDIHMNEVEDPALKVLGVEL